MKNIKCQLKLGQEVGGVTFNLPWPGQNKEMKSVACRNDGLPVYSIAEREIL